MYLSKRMVGASSQLYYQHYEEVINYQLKMINQSCQNAFVKIEIEENKLVYDITSLVPLETYFKNYCFDSQDIKKCFIQMIDTINVSEKFLLYPHQIILEKAYWFYSNDLTQMKLIYLPIEIKNINYHTQLKETMLSLILSHPQFTSLYQDQSIKKLMLLLQEDNFDCYVFRALLVNIRRTSKKRSFKDIGLFKKKKKDKPITDKILEVKMAIDSNSTVLIEEEITYPTIEFPSKKAKINKSSFLIGRSEALTDLSFPEVLSIGRIHAEVVMESDEYYIIDLNTKNGTYINGHKIESQKKCKIKMGDEIKLANEIGYFK